MFKQVCLAAGSLSLLSACTLFAEFGQEPVEREPRSVATQDPHWQRFYELEQQIAQLRQQLDSKPNPEKQAASTENTEENSAVSATKKAEAFLADLKSKADKAISSINNALVALEKQPETQQVEAHQIAIVTPEAEANDENKVSSASPQVSIAGVMQRDEAGEVVQQVTYTQPRQPAYNYSVVYVYPEPQPWNDMWDKLEEAEEQDKWRGSNPAKPSYFIYVGAYLRQEDALKRQEFLLSNLGEGPQLRSNIRNTAIAAK